MSILKYFKNTPWSPPIGRHALSVISFSSNSQRGPWEKKGNVAPQRATGACRPLGGRQGPVARWGGDRVPPPYISPGRHPLCHFSLKIQEKREG